MLSDKKILASKTVWAGLVTVASGVASFYGLTISLDDQLQLTELCVTTVSVISGFATIYFRIKAKTTLK